MELSIEVSGSPKVMIQRIKDVAQKQCCLPILCPACASNQKLIIIGHDYRLKRVRAELLAQELPMGFFKKNSLAYWLLEKFLTLLKTNE